MRFAKYSNSNSKLKYSKNLKLNPKLEPLSIFECICLRMCDCQRTLDPKKNVVLGLDPNTNSKDTNIYQTQAQTQIQTQRPKYMRYKIFYFYLGLIWVRTQKYLSFWVKVWVWVLQEIQFQERIRKKKCRNLIGYLYNPVLPEALIFRKKNIFLKN